MLKQLMIITVVCTLVAAPSFAKDESSTNPSSDDTRIIWLQSNQAKGITVSTSSKNVEGGEKRADHEGEFGMDVFFNFEGGTHAEADVFSLEYFPTEPISKMALFWEAYRVRSCLLEVKNEKTQPDEDQEWACIEDENKVEKMKKIQFCKNVKTGDLALKIEKDKKEKKKNKDEEKTELLILDTLSFISSGGYIEKKDHAENRKYEKKYAISPVITRLKKNPEKSENPGWSYIQQADWNEHFDLEDVLINECSCKRDLVCDSRYVVVKESGTGKILNDQWWDARYWWDIASDNEYRNVHMGLHKDQVVVKKGDKSEKKEVVLPLTWKQEPWVKKLSELWKIWSIPHRWKGKLKVSSPITYQGVPEYREDFETKDPKEFLNKTLKKKK
jgi:hypothetical protein